MTIRPTFQPGEHAVYEETETRHHDVVIIHELDDGSDLVRMDFPDLGFQLNMPGRLLRKTGPEAKSGLSAFLEKHDVAVSP